MSPNQTYFDVFVTDTHVEYHVSSVRDEVLYRQSMSKRVKLGQVGDKRLAQTITGWYNEAYYMGIEHVQSIAPEDK